MNDPIRTWRRRRQVIRLAGAVCTLAGMAWVVHSPYLPVPADTAIVTAHVSKTTEVDERPLDQSYFAIELWNPRPPESPKVQTVEVPPSVVRPPRLQLVGILIANDVKYAALYDPDKSRLHIIAAGEALGEAVVDDVGIDMVVLSDGTRKHALRLSEGRQ
jgi:hypothetical protein